MNGPLIHRHGWACQGCGHQNHPKRPTCSNCSLPAGATSEPSCPGPTAMPANPVGAPQPGEAKPEFPPLPVYPDFNTPVGPLRSRLRELRYTSHHAIRLGGRHICFYDISDDEFEGIYQDVVRLETEVFRLAGLGERLEKARDLADRVLGLCGDPRNNLYKLAMELRNVLTEAPHQ